MSSVPPVVLTLGVQGMGSIDVSDGGKSVGSCSAASCPFSVDKGSTATLTAKPASGWKLLTWTGDCSGSTAKIDVQMTSAKSCSATFVPPSGGSFAVTVAGTTGGTVATNPPLTCTAATCTGTVAAGTDVHITATPESGYRFAAWVGSSDCDGKTDAAITVNVVQELMCSATFVQVFTVTASADTAGATATVTAGSCTAASCPADKGSSVVFTAATLPGYRFTGWGGDVACSGNQPMLTITVAGATSCQAKYKKRLAVTGALQVGFTGAVTASAPDASSTCSGASCAVDAGNAVTLLAPTVSGFRVSGWIGTGCDQGVVAGQGITLEPTTADLTCTAMYVAGVSVSGTVVGAVGTVTATSTGVTCSAGSCAIDAGGEVVLAAPTIDGYRFLGWTGDAGCTSAAMTLDLKDIQSSTSCQANYIQRVTIGWVLPAGVTGAVTTSSSDPTVSCTKTACTIDQGQSLTLSAPAESGFRFLAWSGPGCETGTIKAADATTCTASYAQAITVTGVAAGATATITASSTSPGKDCSSATCTLDAGGSVMLTAEDLSPDDRFVDWTGDAGCTGAGVRTLVLTGVTRSTSCTANYVHRIKVTAGTEAGVTDAVTVTPADPTAELIGAVWYVDEGTGVTLAAPTETLKRFVTWSGSDACNGKTDASITFVPATDVTCTATYQQQFQITVAANVDGSTVTVSAPGCAAGATTCAVDKNATAMLTATVPSGYRFDQWTGDAACTGTSATLGFQVTATESCTASFIHQATVTGIVPGGFTGSVTANAAPPGVCSGNSCTVDEGSSVTLIPPTNTGFYVSGWTGCTGTPSGGALVVTATGANPTCTVQYAPGIAVTGTIVPGNLGAHVDASSTSPGKVCDGMGGCTVDPHGSVTLQAPDLSATGYRFTGWSGDAPCVGGPTAFTLLVSDVTTTVSCTATYHHRVTVTALMPAGLTPAVTVDGSDPTKVCDPSVPSCTVDAGTTVTIKPPVVANHDFTGWTGAGCPAGTGTSLAPTADTTCTAVYALIVNVTAKASAGTPTLSASFKGTACPGAKCTFDAPGDVALSTTDSDAKFRFKNWTCDDGTTSASLGFTISAVKKDTICTANYVSRWVVTGAATGATATVTVTAASPPATCSQSGSQCTIDDGQTVTIAAPDLSSGHIRFAGWNETGCGDPQKPLALTFTATPHGDLTCTAKYVQQYVIVVAAGANGRVGVAAEQACTAPACVCSGSTCTVDVNLKVDLSATPSPTYHFTSWSGSGCTPVINNPLALSNISTTCTAAFAIDTFAVTGTTSPSGVGSVTVTCPGDCTAVPSGSSVTFQANPPGGYAFSSWACTAATNDTTGNVSFKITKTFTCQANFRIVVVGQVAGPSTIAGSASSGTCTTAGTQTVTCKVDPLSNVTFTVTQANDQSVHSWSGCTGSGPTISLTGVSAPATCTANVFDLWAKTLGSPELDVGARVVQASPDELTIQASIQATAVPTPPPHSMWVMSIDSGGKVVIPNHVNLDSFVGSNAVTFDRGTGGWVALGSIKVNGQLPFLVYLDKMGKLTAANEYPFAGSEAFNAGDQTGASVIASSDGAIRMTASMAELRGNDPNAVRLATLDQKGNLVKDREIIDSNSDCQPRASSAGAAVDAGGGTTIVTLVPSGTDFEVAAVKSDGTVVWATQVSAATNVVPERAVAFNGGIVIAGVIQEAGLLASDGFVVWLGPDGKPGFTSGKAGYAIGRMSSMEVTNSEILVGASLGQSGTFLLTGTAVMRGRGDDAWVVEFDPANLQIKEMAYGTTLNELFLGSSAPPSGGYLLAGTTFGKFDKGAPPDLWAMRVADDLSINFNPSVGITAAKTSATVRGTLAATAMNPGCITVREPGLATPLTMKIDSSVVTPDEFPLAP